jgi:hypothetical protein
MSNNDELKWMTERYSWRYIPFRYQALVASITAAFLYFNIFNLLFVQQEGNCGTYFRPQLDLDDKPRGWIWDTFSAGDYGSDVNCSPGYFTGILWSVLFSFAALAICGLVLRRAIKRESTTSIDGSAPGNTSPGWKEDPFNSFKERWWNGSSWTDQTKYKPGMEPKSE